MARVLLPLPVRGFDVTEVAVPWHVLTRAGHEIVFATEHGGETPACDPLLLTGVIFGKLGADAEPKRLYERMTQDAAFRAPLAFADVGSDFDGLVLPGGHEKGMRPYLESQTLFDKVRTFFDRELPVGAICHGTIVLARTRRADGQSVLHGRVTTCLPKYMERLAYWSTAWKLGDYYRTYPEYVEDEVRRALARPEDFRRGPFTTSARDLDADSAASFVVDDGHYVSARWPGDAWGFAKAFLAKL
jgi:putative intracellular protease/amidase